MEGEGEEEGVRDCVVVAVAVREGGEEREADARREGDREGDAVAVVDTDSVTEDDAV